MALVDGWPAQSGVADQIEIRKNLAGLIIRDTSGNARAGVFPRHTNALVTSTATMNVAVATFEAAAVRAGGPVFLNNDGSVNVLLDAAPVANSRYDVVWVRQKENGYGGLADGSNGAEFGFTKGTASSSPSKATVLAAIPAGAIPLAAILLPSTATATNSGGVVITQEFPYTTVVGGRIWARTASDLTAVTGFAADTRAWVFDTGIEYRYSGSAWKPWESDWITYTATLGAAVGTFTVGTGGSALNQTLYRYEQGRVRVRFRFVLGSSGASMGTGPTFTLPVAGDFVHAYQVLSAQGDIYDTSATSYRVLYLNRDNTQTARVQIIYLDIPTSPGGANNPTPTAPWTWAAGDALAGELVYDPA